MNRIVFADYKSAASFFKRGQQICLINEDLDINVALMAIRYRVQAVMVHEGSRYSHGGILLNGNDIPLICIPKEISLPHNGEIGYLPTQESVSWKYGHAANWTEHWVDNEVITIRNPQRHYDHRSGHILAFGLSCGLRALGYKIRSSGTRPEGGMIFASDSPFSSDLKAKCENDRLRNSYLQKATTWLDEIFNTIIKSDTQLTSKEYQQFICDSLIHTTLIHWDYATTLEKIASQSRLSKSQLAQLSMYFAKKSVLGWRVVETAYGDQSKTLKVRQPTQWPPTSCSEDIEEAIYNVTTTRSTVDGVFSSAQIIAVKEWNLFVVQTMLSQLAFKQQ